MTSCAQLVFLVAALGCLASWLPGSAAMSVLVGSDLMQPLTATQYLNSSSFYLVMQPDCNLVLFNISTPVLSTNTSCAPGSEVGKCSLTMDSDGYVSINEIGGPDANFTTMTTSVWSYFAAVGSPRPLYPYMILRDNGTCDFFDFNGNLLHSDFPLLTPYSPLASPIADTEGAVPGSDPFPPALAWKPKNSLDGFPYLPAGYFLNQGSKLQTVDQAFVLELGKDCILQSKNVLQNGSVTVLWESGTGSSEVRDCRLLLQQDGRLEIRSDVSGVVFWSTSVAGVESVSWILRMDLVSGGLSVSDIEASNNILWANFELNQARTRKSKRTTTWVVIGVVGGVFVLAIAGLAFLYHYARASIRKPEKDFRRRVQGNGTKTQTLYSQSKIKEATSNFAKKIGHGGFGDVFYGTLDGQEVAAKVLSSNSHHLLQEFYNEIELLSVVHHKYLVSLLGYSFTRKHQTLIYEYMGGGDLRQRLQGQGAATNPLSWRQRTDIIVQVAEGLEYLHDKCSPAIIHRDVKSNNILLTNKLVAKVADFGLSKLRTLDQEDATHITTVVKGTPGYLDPEYHDTGMLTVKSDVYAYGIVLMEILTGRHQMCIVQTVSDAQKSGEFDELADVNLSGDYARDEFVELVELSLWCARRSNFERPFMHQVVQRLREILPSLQRDGSVGVGESGGNSRMAMAAAAAAAAPLLGASSSTGDCKLMISEEEAAEDPEKACDSRVCTIDHRFQRSITMYSYRQPLATALSGSV